jgi:hypothetical protein
VTRSRAQFLRQTHPRLTLVLRLSQVTTVHFEKPEGWQTIDLRDSGGGIGGDDDDDGCVPALCSCGSPADSLTPPPLPFHREPISAFLIQITVVANHLNGKDTHIRGLRIWGPESFVPCPAAACIAHC